MTVKELREMLEELGVSVIPNVKKNEEEEVDNVDIWSAAFFGSCVEDDE